MAVTIVIFNQKGGVGKTTSAVNLAHSFSEDNKVLLVDMDAQANATNGLGIDENELGEKTIYKLLSSKKTLDPKDYIISTDFGVDLLPSDIGLAGAEQSWANFISREQLLKKALQKIEHEYDYIFIDAPPSLGLLSVNALAASQYILVPVEPAYYSVKGIVHLIDTYETIRDAIKPDLEILGIVMTRYEKTRMAADLEADLRETFGNKIMTTRIRKNQAIKNAQDDKKPIGAFDKSSNGYKDYMELKEELEGILNGGE